MQNSRKYVLTKLITDKFHDNKNKNYEYGPEHDNIKFFKRNINCLNIVVHIHQYLTNLEVSEFMYKKVDDLTFDIIMKKIEEVIIKNKDPLKKRYEQEFPTIITPAATQIVMESLKCILNLLNISNTITIADLIKYFKSVKFEMLTNMNQVAREQLTFLEINLKHLYDTKNKTCNDIPWYVELYLNDDTEPIISMFALNFKIKNKPNIQIHQYIVKNIKMLILKHTLKYSSIFLHSFASDMFENANWYTRPIGKMGPILENIIGTNNVFLTNQNNEVISLHDTENKKCYKYGLSLPPQYTINITDDFKNFWKIWDKKENSMSLNGTNGDTLEIQNDDEQKIFIVSSPSKQVRTLKEINADIEVVKQLSEQLLNQLTQESQNRSHILNL
jgi:hypothetical protein